MNTKVLKMWYATQMGIEIHILNGQDEMVRQLGLDPAEFKPFTPGPQRHDALLKKQVSDSGDKVVGARMTTETPVYYTVGDLD